MQVSWNVKNKTQLRINRVHFPQMFADRLVFSLACFSFLVRLFVYRRAGEVFIALEASTIAI